MGKKKVAIKSSLLRQEAECLPLEGLELTLSADNLAEQYISKLQADGFITKNKAYLANYINSDVGIAFSHIKTAYKQYVISGGWTDKKFSAVIDEIMLRRVFFNAKSFLSIGIDYDSGKLKNASQIADERKAIAEMLRRNQL
jgi:hypothetical protein